MQREGRCTGTLTKQVRASLLSSEGSHLAMQPANTQRTECRFPQPALGRSDLVQGWFHSADLKGTLKPRTPLQSYVAKAPWQISRRRL